MNFGIVIDRNPNGSVKRCKGDYVRFELRLKNEASETVAFLRGFRYDEAAKTVFMPSGGRFQNIPLTLIADALLIEVKTRLETILEKEKTTTYF